MAKDKRFSLYQHVAEKVTACGMGTCHSSLNGTKQFQCNASQSNSPHIKVGRLCTYTSTFLITFMAVPTLPFSYPSSSENT
jgi:hypothetical protein